MVITRPKGLDVIKQYEMGMLLNENAFKGTNGERTLCLCRKERCVPTETNRKGLDRSSIVISGQDQDRRKLFIHGPSALDKQVLLFKNKNCF